MATPKKQRDYAPHLIAFIILIAILASACSSTKEIEEPRPITYEQQYFFLNGEIVMIPTHTNP